MRGGTFKDNVTGNTVNREKMMEIIADYLRKARDYHKVKIESWGFKCIDESGKFYFIQLKARGSYSHFPYGPDAFAVRYDEVFHVVDFSDELIGTLVIYACDQQALKALVFAEGYQVDPSGKIDNKDGAVRLLKDSKIRRISKTINIEF